jgi:hypothetical protein
MAFHFDGEFDESDSDSDFNSYFEQFDNAHDPAIIDYDHDKGTLFLRLAKIEFEEGSRKRSLEKLDLAIQYTEDGLSYLRHHRDYFAGSIRTAMCQLACYQQERNRIRLILNPLATARPLFEMAMRVIVDSGQQMRLSEVMPLEVLKQSPFYEQ